MPELTDKEIVKALECCSINKKCTGCYFNTQTTDDMCPRVLMRNTLDLINRQKQEIEELTAFANQLEEQRNMWMEKCDETQVTNKYLQERNVILRGLVDTQKAENESLGITVNSYKKMYEDIQHLEMKVDKIKAEAYKECIEKVKERLAVHSFTSNSTEYTDGMLDCMEWVDSKIEELEKELVGENNG
jgi:GTP-binding protein EngB required for normal cell division